MSLSQYERKMVGPVWNAYMAGRHAETRDKHLRQAREAKNPEIRGMQVSFAKHAHRAFLKSARAAVI